VRSRRQPGEFIREVGVSAGALAVGVPKAIKLGSVFCVRHHEPDGELRRRPAGPGATSVVGTVTLLP
jgi:hypothetical protein